MDKLTDRQADVMVFIRTYIAINQMPPTRAEIAKHFGFNVNAAQEHLIALEKKSRIKLLPGTARGIRVL